MKKLLTLIALMLMIGCDDPITSTCPLVDMPKVSDIVPPEQVEMPSKMVFLLDYSGSMYPTWEQDGASKNKRTTPYFYAEKGFSNLLGKWLDKATPVNKDMNMDILLFNNKVYSFRPDTGSIRSFTKLNFSLDVGNAGESTIASWIDKIPDNPYTTFANPGKYGKANDLSKINEALQSILSKADEDTVIWLLTDNLVEKKQKGTDKKEADANKEFYDNLRKNPKVKAVLGYPIRDKSLFKERSLFFYGIFVSYSEATPQKIRHLMGEGAQAKSAVDGIIWNSHLASLSKNYSCNPQSNKGRPIRLRPIDTEVLTVRLNPKALNVQSIHCPDVEFNSPVVKCFATVDVTNNLNHQIVTNANIDLRQQILRVLFDVKRPSWITDICADSFKIEKWTTKNGQGTSSNIVIKDLKPKETQEVKIRFSIQNPQIAISNFNELLEVAQTSSIGFAGELYVTVDGIKTKLESKKADLSCIARSDELPEMFRKQSQSSPSTVKEDITFSLKNAGTEQALIILAFFGLIAGAIILFLIRMQQIVVEVRVDGKVHPESPVSLPRVSVRKLAKDKNGSPVFKITRGWAGKSYSVKGINGYVVHKKDTPGHFTLYPLDDDSDRTSIEVVRYGTSRKRSSSSKDSGIVF